MNFDVCSRVLLSRSCDERGLGWRPRAWLCSNYQPPVVRRTTVRRKWTRGGRGRWQPTKDGDTAGRSVVSPMRRDERERRQPHEVRRASTGATASNLVLEEVLAARRKVRSPPSVDRGAARREHQRLADDGDGGRRRWRPANAWW